MAKRALEAAVRGEPGRVEDSDAPALKKAKKEKKQKKQDKENASNGVEEGKRERRSKHQRHAEGDGGGADESGAHEEDEKAAKAARKALKRAKREQEKAADGADSQVDKPQAEESTAAGSDTAKAAAKAERKALKRANGAETDGKKRSKHADASDGTTGQANRLDSDISRSNADDVPTGYSEDSRLTALPQADIDTFNAEKFIAVTDPKAGATPFRPITLFEYLPITDRALRAPFASFTTPTPIQAAAWPYLLSGRDVVGVAETGSGKTLAFGVPCIRHIQSLPPKEQKKNIQACIVSPTRELALQIHEQLEKLASPAGLKVACVYGGVNKDAQRETLRGVSAIVATPGRLNDFISEGSIDLSRVRYLVLDEADRMLDKGFEEEMRKIISTTPSSGRQTLMFTATWPPAVRQLAETFMNVPVKVAIGDNPTGELRANTRIDQEVEVMNPYDKNDRLIAILKQYQSGKNKADRILVFCLYKKEATRIEGFIRSRGFNVGGIHGDMTQQQRTTNLEAFKVGKVPVLVATDVAARGLDIPAVKLVLNVTFPLTSEDYVHRIGRTGRAGQTGKAITFFTEHEKGLAGALINVLKAANQPVPEALMKFGTTVKKKAHDTYGAFYKDPGEMKKATKITFD